MGNTVVSHSHNHVKMYSVRVTCKSPRDNTHHTKYLDYICPDGTPVWTSSRTTYASRITSFEAAQRLCRQLFTSPHFPVGCKVQFNEQVYSPSYQSDKIFMNKIRDRTIPQATVRKPVMDAWPTCNVWYRYMLIWDVHRTGTGTAPVYIGHWQHMGAIVICVAYVPLCVAVLSYDCTVRCDTQPSFRPIQKTLYGYMLIGRCTLGMYVGSITGIYT